MNRFQFVADHHRRYGVKRLCIILGIARSSFYDWRRTAADRAARHAADARLASRIRAVHREPDGTYGVPRITAELREAGERVNHKPISRVMRGAGLVGVRLRRRHRTTVADPAAAKAGSDRPRLHRKRAEHEIRRRHYLSPAGRREVPLFGHVIDLASRPLAGWAIADHMRTDLETDALAAAERTRGSLAGAVMHTDHGAQYTSRAFAGACRQAGVGQSMSAIGSSADNALAESFNATFKRETLQGRKTWSREREARLDAFGWLNRYNTRRRHSRLGQRSPIAYETASETTSTTLTPAA
ncbi:IS3 family transposase [Streptomyces sp. NPDC007905]|uniref:IS3 family transposase n=1 Tax=Streptomyces sp. NPDC007905 TaxID=3364788 RepID=UPI0036E0005B